MRARIGSESEVLFGYRAQLCVFPETVVLSVDTLSIGADEASMPFHFPAQVLQTAGDTGIIRLFFAGNSKLIYSKDGVRF